jgi:hypothetical protein
VLGLVFKTSVGHSVSQVGSTPTSFRQFAIRLPSVASAEHKVE